MDEADVRRILAYPHTMIGSDGLPHDAHPHPRLWGTFPRVIGHYGRDEGLFPPAGGGAPHDRPAGRDLPPARHRGVLAEGNYADLTVFDPDTIADRATFDDPTLPAAGIEHGLRQWRPCIPSATVQPTGYSGRTVAEVGT